MRYYKQASGGYIVAVGTGRGGEEISADEYTEIVRIIRDRPTAPEGYGYRLTEGLEWELYELPPEESDPELTAEEALEIILGGGV